MSKHCDSSACGSQYAESSTLRRVLWVAFGLNFSMFFVEIISSVIGNSVALQSDALDFFSDSVNYLLSLLVLGSALQTRAKAALFKAICMLLFGLWIIFNAISNGINGSSPNGQLMSTIGLLALVTNVFVAFLLFRYRDGDSNLQSIWLCSRNDAISNVAIIFAAFAVIALQTHWPDIIVAILIASLALHSSYTVLTLARNELLSNSKQK